MDQLRAALTGPGRQCPGAGYQYSQGDGNEPSKKANQPTTSHNPKRKNHADPESRTPISQRGVQLPPQQTQWGLSEPSPSAVDEVRRS